jgi:calcium-dependent protein kinase
MVLEYLSGGNLRYHLYAKRVFTENQIQFICANIVEALDACHSIGIIHKDIKPENLIFDN